MHVLEMASSSVTVKLAVTVPPTATGFGETLVIVTVGARSLIVIDAVLEPVLPAASVALTVMVNALLATPPVLYTWDTGLAAQTLEPSPKLTHVLEIASSSVAVKLILTLAPSLALAGAVTVTVGATSLIVIDAVFEPVTPAASVALTVMVNALLATAR